MIDTSIITNGAAMQQAIQQNNMQQLQQLGGNLGQLVLGRRINQMRQLKTPKEQQAFANNSIFSPMLNAQLTADKAAAAKAAADQLKFNADLTKTYSDIGKTDSEALKNNQQASGYGLDNAGKVGSAVQKAIGFGATTGNKRAIIDGLNLGKSTGEITPEAYQTAITALGNLNSIDDIKKFGLAMLDPKYSLTTADNVLDNQTSVDNNVRDNNTSANNNIRTTQASIYGTDKQFQSDQDKLEFAKGKISPLYTEGQAALKNGAKFETIGGVTYIDLGNGKGIPYVDQDGKPLSATSKANGVPKLSDNALKQVNEASTQLSQARQSYTKIGGLVNDLKGGKLDLSASNIVAAKGRMALGLSTPNDLAIDRFQAALNQAANDVLMMAKGTQTEGDAQRAVATITANPPRDNNAAMQALNTLAGIQRNTINTLNGNINTIYDNYGIARPGINKPSQNGGGSPANNTGGRSSLSSILFE